MHLGTPSPRKKRNNSTPTKKNAAEKKQILQHLVSPALNQQPTLGELIQLSENAQNHLSTSDFQNFDGRIRETSFSDGLSTEGATKPFNDLKLEKKVTFARLLNKMSAEIKTGTEVETLSVSNVYYLPCLAYCVYFIICKIFLIFCRAR